MPKPFKRSPNQKVSISPSAVVRRPHLAIGIANIASHWSKLEHTISIPFTLLLGGQEPSAFESYHELFEVSLRHKMYVAAARRKRVSKELLEESEVLHKKVRKAASQRNRVVHGTWAYCDDLPNSLLLCDPSGLNRKLDEFLGQLHDTADDFTSGQRIEPWSFDLGLDEYEEYQNADFNEITDRIIALDKMAMAYWTKISAFSIGIERERRARRGRR
jgi:hypothetical protein